jgi:dTDP-4-amino-4,6-dideoxygalactose transaminase
MIKLLVPDMPTADDLLPYLRKIDVARVYVNQGQFVQELEARLEDIAGMPCVAVSSGTAALELALQALSIDRSVKDDGLAYCAFVAVPALTFAASGLSIVANGLTPMLCDVHRDSWQLTPNTVADTGKPIISIFDNLEAVMPVATFGIPVDVALWENYHVPVIVDAAGAFPAQVCGKDPNIATCFSLHATKFIGCGEGGFVASTNKELLARVRSLAMFGYGGTNARMSEYHAAVASASLDRIATKSARAREVFMWYGKHCKGLELTGYMPGTVMNALSPVPITSAIIHELLEAGIETKQWYRPYLDERTEFGAHHPGTHPVTDHLRAHLLGIPFHNFLTEKDVAYVCEMLRRVLK